MKKTLLLTFSLSLFLLAGLSLVTTQAEPVTVNANVQPNNIVAAERKIGLLTPLSGTLGALGVTFIPAANLAIDDLNTKYTNQNFSLVVQDTQSSDVATALAATALVNAGVLGVAGAARSAGTIAAEAVLTPNEIPLISYASTSPAITALTDSDYVFRVVPSDALQGIAAAKLVTFAGITSVATIGINDAYGLGLVNAFVANSPLTPLVSIAYDLTQTDFTADVTTLIAGDPDAVYMASFLDDGAAILNALALQGFTGPIIGADGIASPKMFNIAGVNASMHLLMGTAPTFAATSSFTSRYVAAVGTTPGVFVAEAYDAVMLIGEAIMNATTVGASIRDALKVVGTNYTVGASAANITFDAKGDLIGGNYDVWQVQTTGSAASLVTTGNYNPNTDVLAVWDNMLQTDWIAANTNVSPAPTTSTPPPPSTTPPITATITATATETGTVTATATNTATKTEVSVSVSVSTKTETPVLFSVFVFAIVSLGFLIRVSKRKN